MRRTTDRLGSPALGTRSAVGLIGTAAILGLTPGAAGAVSYAYLAAAPVVAWRLVRRHPAAFIVFVLWLWLLTPEVRRIANFTSAWVPDDPIMAAPGIASLVAARGLVGHRLPRAASPVVIALMAVGYGFLVGGIQAGPSAAIAGLVLWLPPGVVGLLAMSDAIDTDALRRAIAHISLWGTITVSVYGLVQFFWLPQWDRFWMVNSGLTSIGVPLPEKVRVFSTLNAPFPLGVVLAAMLIGAVGSRSRFVPAAWIPGIAVLGLSQARSGWAGWAVGILALFAIGRRVGRRGIALALLPLVAVTVFGGAATDTIRTRFEQTTEAGVSDDSLSARISFHREMIPEALADPVGRGVGSTGVASAQADADADSLGTFDGGIPESLFALGGVVGSAYLAAAASLVWRAVHGARRRGTGAVPAAAATVTLAIQVLFGNSLIAGAGVFLFVFAAAATRTHSVVAEQEPALVRHP